MTEIKNYINWNRRSVTNDKNNNTNKSETKSIEAKAFKKFSTVDKAGLSSVNTEEVERILSNNSQESLFSAASNKSQEELNKKIQKRKQRVEEIRGEDLQPGLLCAMRIQSVTSHVDRYCKVLESQRHLDETWFHIDMDQFFCACEARDDPSLVGIPFAVGDSSMLSTSSYEARKFGVRSAMPGFQARKLCPELKIIPPNMAKYEAVARLIRDVFAEYDPNYMTQSVDEACLNMTQFLKDQTPPNRLAFDVANEIKCRILEETRCSCSIGIATEKRLAKIASNRNKPNGIHHIPPNVNEIIAFMNDLNVRQIAGIGPVLEGELNGALGIVKVGDIWNKRYLLARLMPEKLSWFLNIALGFPSEESSIKLSSLPIGRPVTYSQEIPTKKVKCNLSMQKSISHEQTFAAGVGDVTNALSKSIPIVQKLARSMTELQVKGKMITLKLKSTKFVDFSRSKSVTVPITAEFESIWPVFERLIKSEFHTASPVRLIGVTISDLIYPDGVLPSLQRATSMSGQQSITKFLSK
jgi:DNA polymerase kappa